MRPFFFFMLCCLFHSAQAQHNPAEKIYAEVNDAVLNVVTYNADRSPHSQGSGVVLKSRGWMITNFHVFNGAQSLYASHRGRWLKLDSIVRADAARDILILAIDTKTEADVFAAMPDLKIADESKFRIGQTVYAIGNPFGFESTITNGLLSGLRTMNDSSMKVMQISAPISPGSSGGAVVNSKGELMGITSMQVRGEAQNINFAIFMSDVLNFDAKTARKDLIQETPEEAQAMSTGVDYYHAGEYQKAMPFFRKTFQPPADTLVHATYYLGRCWELLNREDSALYYYRACLRINPQYPDTYMGIARVALIMGNTELAMKEEQIAFALDPTLRTRKVE